MTAPAEYSKDGEWSSWNWTGNRERWDAFRWSNQRQQIMDGLPLDTMLLVRCASWESEPDFRLWRLHAWGVSLAEGLLTALPIEDGMTLHARASGAGAGEALGRLRHELVGAETRSARLRGALWGLAVGDSLGVPHIGRRRVFMLEHPVTSPTFGGIHGQPAGTWSKTTSSCLVALDALQAGYRSRDHVLRLHRWIHFGERTARGEAFDVGTSLEEAVYRSLDGPVGQVEPGDSDDAAPLAGALAVALWFAESPAEVIAAQAMQVCGTTHQSERVRVAGAWCALIAHGLLQGVCVREAVREAGQTVGRGLPDRSDIHPEPWRAGGERSTGILGLDLRGFERLVDLSVCDLPREALDAGGSAIAVLEAVVWCLARHTTYAGAVLEAVHLGREADVLGALVGGLAGMRDGDGGVPDAWRAPLLGEEHLAHAVSQLASPPTPAQRPA